MLRKLLVAMSLVASIGSFSNSALADTVCSGTVDEVFIGSNNPEKDSLGWGGVATLYINLNVSGSVYKIALCGLDGQVVSRVTSPQTRCASMQSLALAAQVSGKPFEIRHSGSNNCSKVDYITKIGIKR
ncbi:MAG: hypothetical protein HRU19_28515 [Pseudobacteriovorax sp.]|nr:hypothetical protein [Pseudobacteriovorax sp.]